MITSILFVHLWSYIFFLSGVEKIFLPLSQQKRSMHRCNGCASFSLGNSKGLGMQKQTGKHKNKALKELCAHSFYHLLGFCLEVVWVLNPLSYSEFIRVSVLLCE